MVFTNWINGYISSEKLIVTDLMVDLGDGIIISLLCQKLTGQIVVDWSCSSTSKMQKMINFCKFIEDHFEAPQDESTWTMHGLTRQDPLSIFYLLWKIASKYAQHLYLPGTLIVNQQGVPKTIWLDWKPQESLVYKHEFDFKDELSILLQDDMQFRELQDIIVNFVNKALDGTSLQISSLTDASVLNGVALILLVASLEDFFVSPSVYYLEPESEQQKQRNLNVAFTLMGEMGVDLNGINTIHFTHPNEKLITRCM